MSVFLNDNKWATELPTKWAGKVLEYGEELESTNQTAACLGRSDGVHGTLVVADKQTGGRGRRGRSWESPAGKNLYFSLLLRPKMPVEKISMLTLVMAHSVAKAIEKTVDIQVGIKWPNDIFVNDKKICGILIENTFLGDKIASSVVGVGLNVCNALEEELAEIAITMQQATGKTFSVEEVRERLIRELQRAHTMDEYLSYIGYLGRRVTLILGDERIPATLVSVETDGKLRAETENGERLFSSAEVSLRI